MGRAGILHEDERVELLNGEILIVPPIGHYQAGCVIFLNSALNVGLDGRAILGVHAPVRVSDFDEPEPDLSVLRPRADYYRRGHPTPKDVLLLIEVSDTTVGYDRHTKGPRYAAAGIVEMWLVNLAVGQIEIYRDPAPDGYHTTITALRGDTVSPLAFPDLALSVDDILGDAAA